MAETSTWWVYMIATQGQKLYTGITTHIPRRFGQHLSGQKAGGARFFHTDPPVVVVFAQAFPNRGSATSRERAIKQLTRTQKLRLIEDQIFLPTFLSE